MDKKWYESKTFYSAFLLTALACWQAWSAGEVNSNTLELLGQAGGLVGLRMAL